MKSSTRGALIALSVATMFAARDVRADDTAKDAPKTDAKVKCSGVNECAGKGSCGGAGNSCAGKNSCKGKGVMDMSAEDCAKKGGKGEK